MTVDKLKKEILELRELWEAIDEKTIGDFKDAEFIEIEAEDLIVSYCERQGYMVNGFPTEKRKILDEELHDDYFTRERFRLYLDSLSLEKNDVAELWWFYNKSFWPDWVDSKEAFIKEIKEQIENNVYDIEL
jgi:hypothetical protein